MTEAFVDPDAGTQDNSPEGNDDGTLDVTEERQVVDENGTPKETSWRESLPQDLAEHPAMSKFNGKNFDEVVKSYINLEKYIGGEKLPAPKESWEQKDWDDFYNKLGRPETPDAYEIGEPDEMPDGFAYNKDFEASFRKVAHEKGLTNKQAKDLWGHLQQTAIDGYQQFNNQMTDNMNQRWQSLKQEWGQSYDGKLKLANKVFSYANDDFKKWFTDNQMGKQPEMLKLFAQMGEHLSEDRINATQERPANRLSPSEAASEHERVMRENWEAYTNKSHPDHTKIMEKINRLAKLAESE